MAISQKMEKRAVSFGIIIVTIFVILTLRLGYLQLVQGKKYYAEAEDNRINFYTIGAPRGKIITADNKILVYNKMAYSASIRVSELKDQESFIKTVDTLVNLLNVNRTEILENLARNIIDGVIVLRENLTPAEKAIVQQNSDKLPGVKIESITNEEGQLVGENLVVNIRTVSTLNLLKSAKLLSEILPVKYEDILMAVIANGAKDRDTLKIKRNLTQEEMVVLEELRSTLPGVVVEKISIRDYVYGSASAHMLGYIGAISAEEFQDLKSKGYRGDDFIGKAGLEKYYEQYLRGQDGREEIEVDSRSRKIRTLGIRAPIPGSNLITNIDLGMQLKAEYLLDEMLFKLKEQAKWDRELKGGPKGGAVIVMNVNNGKILAMVSRPTFDLNLFAGGINPEEFKKLTSADANKPFVNRAVGVTPPPGSIFKLVTASTFLEEKYIDERTIVNDADGRYRIGQWTYDNWARKTHGGYGPLDIYGAIAHSNNIFFYQIAHKTWKLSSVKIPEYARGFGLGKLTGIDLPKEAKGIVPDPDYKQRVFNEGWRPGDSLHLSIGQGSLQTTPIQLLNYMSAIANGGKLYRPYVVDRIESYDGQLIEQFEPQVIGKLPIKPKTLDILRKGLVGVTTYGTAAGQLKNVPVVVAGKTGTAQNTSAVANHGWFAGYAPADKPEIAIMVFLEHGTSSSYTLPVVKELVKYYFTRTGNELPMLMPGPHWTPGFAPDPTLAPWAQPPAGTTTPGASGTTPPTTPGTTPPAGTTQQPVTAPPSGTGSPVSGSKPDAVTPPANDQGTVPVEGDLTTELKDFYDKAFSTP